MIQINQLNLRLGQDEAELVKKSAKLLGVRTEQIEKFQIIKKSIDARKKPDIFFSYTVILAVPSEGAVLKRCRDKRVSRFERKEYCFPVCGQKEMHTRPVIVGMGPAGLFCGYFLAKHGYKPILLERGKDVENRKEDVEKFWRGGALLPNSNVQFGEGGAGTFSDGKLNTLIKDKDGRNRKVLELFVECGAPEAILYESKPHIGTDILSVVVKRMREKILAFGGEVYFESQVTKLVTEGGAVTGVIVNEKEMFQTNQVILAIGHSARDTFQMLYEEAIPMEAKAFAVGFRVQHPQEMIDRSQYGFHDPKRLPPSPYKVTAQTTGGRGVYSFCMCPGGYVVDASSEPNRLAVNGMSYSKRDGKNANSAIILTVTPEDFEDGHPLAGIAFQRELEKRAYEAGNGKIPCEYYGDFKAETEKLAPAEFEKEISMESRGEYCFTDLTQILPKELNQAFVEGMEAFGKMITGFARPDALLAGVESRTSSPVRITRDLSMQSVIRGLYPCGEGAGYAGGITSAAMDGIRVAEAIASDYKPLDESMFF